MKQIYILLLLATSAFAQEKINISGHVADAVTKEPIIAASVAVINTTTGTVVNEEGDFQLVAENNATLAIYCLGYKKASVPISEFGAAKKMIYLEQDEQKIEEVIVSNMPIEKILENLIKTSTARFNRPIVLNTYYREFVKQNGQYIKFADGQLDYHVKGSGSKPKTDLIVKQSRAARIAQDENYDPDAFLDVRHRISRIYTFDFVDRVLLKGKNYKNYILMLNSLKDATGKELYMIKIQPRNDVKKSLYKGSIVYDPSSNLILDFDIFSSPEHTPYLPSVSILGYKVELGEHKLKASYRMQGNNYVALHSAGKSELSIFNKRRNLNEKVESKFDMIVNNFAKSDGVYPKTEIYDNKDLYSRGNKYASKFWQNSNALVLTSEEQNIIKKLEATSQEPVAQ